MSESEKEKIKQFMRLVLFQLHPQWQEYYPFKDMKQVEHSQGCGFDGTEYEDNEILQSAYYMNKVIETL